MGHLFKTAVLIVILTLYSFNPISFAQTWEQTIGPYGGSVICLAINASGDIFAGTSSGGLFRLDLSYICGDANGDWQVNVGDAVYIIAHVFKGGPPPESIEAGDANCDGNCNVGDAVYLINHVFRGGLGPCADCPPTGTLTARSDCKSFEKTSTASESTPTNQDCIEYQYDGVGTLSLRHINAGFNCCPLDMIIDINIEDNIITIDESKVEGDCSCNCLFDLDYEIQNLPPGEYTIVVSERFTFPDEELLEFSINLTSSPIGSFCVTRNYYPWGY
ncbi:MAG: dockerin type I repeat-containing protein [candidate division Zixibacteria bacterium]